MVERSLYHLAVEELGGDPHIMSIEPAPDFDLPDFKDLRWERFNFQSQVLATSVRKLVLNLYTDLKSPLIADNFNLPQERDAWLAKIEMASPGFYEELWTENALRPTFQTGLSDLIKFISRHSGVDSNTAWGKKFYDLVDQIRATATRSDYRELERTEQIAHVRYLMELISKFLKHLAS